MRPPLPLDLQWGIWDCVGPLVVSELAVGWRGKAERMRAVCDACAVILVALLWMVVSLGVGWNMQRWEDGVQVRVWVYLILTRRPRADWSRHLCLIMERLRFQYVAVRQHLWVHLLGESLSAGEMEEMYAWEEQHFNSARQRGSQVNHHRVVRHFFSSSASGSSYIPSTRSISTLLNFCVT